MRPFSFRSLGRQRAVAAAVVGTTVLGLLGLAALPATAVTAAARTAVRSGHARFEVLSPTLIRTEYAADGHFTDAATFNVIGRDASPPTPFTTRVADGWLTIDTGALTLRYRVGSGAFTADNLTVRLKPPAGRGRRRALGRPDARLRRSARSARPRTSTLHGPGVATDHAGSPARGFAAGFETTGDSLTFAEVDTAPRPARYELAVRYANSTGGDGQDTTRTLTVTVDGAAARTLTLPPTANWDTWATSPRPLDLTAGRHTVAITAHAADSGNVNIDSLALCRPGAAYPGPATGRRARCAFGTICEAETGALAGGATLRRRPQRLLRRRLRRPGSSAPARADDHPSPACPPPALRAAAALRQRPAGRAGAHPVTTGRGRRTPVHARRRPAAGTTGARRRCRSPAAGDRRRHARLPDRRQLPRQPRHRRRHRRRRAAARPARRARRLPARPGRRRTARR